jgi:hypothetical protein
MSRSIDVAPEVVTAAARAATAAAVARLRVLGWTTDEIIAAVESPDRCDAHLLCRTRDALQAAMPQAREDFAEAVRARMPSAALQTFAASAALAGISAANAHHQAERPARVEAAAEDGIALHLPEAPSIGIED